MLLNVGEFHENRHRKIPSFTMGVNKTTFTRVPWYRQKRMPCHSVCTALQP